MNKPSTYSTRLVSNSLFNLSATVGTSIIAFFLVPFLVRCLGKEGYGVWVLVGSVFAYTMTLQLGLSSAINRYIAVYLVKEDKAGIDRTISTSVFFLGFIGLIVFVVSVVLSRNLEQWFTIPPNLVGPGKALVLIVGGLFALSMPARPFGAVVSGLQRYDVHGLGRFIPIALRAVLVVWMLSADYGLIAVGLIYGFCEITIYSVYWLFSRKLLGSIVVSPKSVDFALLREMLTYGINTFLFVTTAIIVYKGGDIILGVFLTAGDVTKFALAAAPLMMVTQLLEASVAALKPAVSDLDARDDHQRVREISFLSQKYSLLLLFPAISFLILLGGEFLVLWVGADFAELSSVLVVLAVGRFFMATQYSNFLVLVGKGEHKAFGAMAVTTAGTAMVLGVVLVGVLDRGVMGMAVASAVPMVLVYGLVMPLYYNRRMNISIAQLARFVFRPALLGSALAIVLIVVWKLVLPPNSWLRLGLVILSVAMVWMPSVWTMGLSRLERERFLRILRAWKSDGARR